MQVAMYLMAAYIIRQVSSKYEELKLKNNLIPVQEQTLMFSEVPKMTQSEFEKYLKERWTGISY